MFHEVLEFIPEQHHDIAKEYIEELSFMRSLLDNLKKEVARTGATSLFQNGKQSYTRQTPEYKAYVEVLNRYNQYLKQLLALLPVEEGEATNELADFLKAGVV